MFSFFARVKSSAVLAKINLSELISIRFCHSVNDFSADFRLPDASEVPKPVYPDLVNASKDSSFQSREITSPSIIIAFLNSSAIFCF